MIAVNRIKRIAKVVADTSVLAGAFGLAFLLRFEGSIPERFADAMLFYLPIVLICKLTLLAVAGRFKATWRFMNLHDTVSLFILLVVVTIPFLSLALVRSALPGIAHVLPVGVVVLDLLLGFVGLAALRAAVRLSFEMNQRRAMATNNDARVPTLLIGAGRAGAILAKEIKARRDSDIQLVGFLDDDQSLVGMHVEGIPVLGGTRDLDRFVQRYRIRQAIITIAHAQEKAIPRIAQLCEACGLRTKIIPPLHEIVEGKINLAKIREVSIEDLLRRRPVRLDFEEIEKIVRKQTVLVTGAGGSIGSELCRTIARLRPATLVLVEQAENSLFQIHTALAEAFPDLHIVPCIADICDEARMDAIFAEWRPPLVFHAAAHKHVPMMEWNPGEAVKNNVLGTRTIAKLADAWQVERFVMISTDKAVNPSSVMGASKRVAELFIQAFAQRSATRFMTVRFGNVLGSAGSVIPTFQRQIAAGGPVTVTHPEMKRYFMTIAEACQLVLQAGAMGQGSELFILDMGDPVKIVDLARDLIRLSGLTPDQDVKIRFTGLRPGEKLAEQLSLGEEDLLKTANPRIFIGKVTAPKYAWINNAIVELGEFAGGGGVHKIRAKLKEIVPEYQSQELREDQADEQPIKPMNRSRGMPTASQADQIAALNDSVY